MPDEGQQQEGQQQQEAPVALVNADGTFAANWRDSLPEDIRADKSLDVVTDFNGLVSQHVNAQKMLGKDKVVLPGPNATDEEKDAFFTAIGRPATPGDYQFALPDEMKELVNADRLKDAKEIAHKLGITQAQFEGYMKAELEAAGLAVQGAEEQQALDMQNGIDEMRKRFGGAYDERMHIANRLVHEICKGDADESRKIALLEAFGNNPDFIEFVSDCGAKLVEHKALIAEMTQDTPKEAVAKLDELRATPGFITADPATGKLLAETDPAKKKAILAEIDKLTLQAYPETRPPRPGA